MKVDSLLPSSHHHVGEITEAEREHSKRAEGEKRRDGEERNYAGIEDKHRQNMGMRQGKARKKLGEDMGKMVKKEKYNDGRGGKAEEKRESGYRRDIGKKHGIER